MDLLLESFRRAPSWTVLADNCLQMVKHLCGQQNPSLSPSFPSLARHLAQRNHRRWRRKAMALEQWMISRRSRSSLISSSRRTTSS
ncbi:hypothetical protein niasHS_008595 [Heterodera schachtii]|uniref:Uncharacterized protein n=2 Tax=Heterodera TaxID=34509 RepID=A0ABD2J886_HETSC